VKEFVRFGIDGGVQPLLLTVDSNYCLVERITLHAQFDTTGVPGDG
jgi:hypothetical protein